MPRFLSLLRRHTGLLILLLAGAAVYQHFFLSRAYIEFDYTTDHDTAIQMLWAGEGEQFSRSCMATAPLPKNSMRTGFFLGSLSTMRSFRFDPMGKESGTVVFRRITITQPGWKPLIFAAQADFARFRPGKNVSEASFAEGWGWVVRSDSGDPDFYVDHFDPPPRDFVSLAKELSRFLLLALLLHLLLQGFAPLTKDFGYVPLLLLGVTLLTAVLAVTTNSGSHPDELVHEAAASYYEQHWLMPAAESPEIAATYSGYGVSRLNSREIAYFLIGKFSRLVEIFRLPSFQRQRLFNVALLACLVLLTVNSTAARLLLLPFLMTPQGWYLFGYCNSDAFALFLTLLACQQLAEPESLFNRLLAGRTTGWLPFIQLGLLAGLLLLIKKNFYIVILFAAFCLLLEFVCRQRTFSWPTLRRIAALVGIGTAIFGLRTGLDISVNGWNKAATIQQLREERAERAYKPSTELAKQHPHLNLKGRGVRLQELLGDKYRWGGHIIRSFYGVYGQMSVAASKSYFTLMIRCGWLFLATVYLTVLLRGGWTERLLLLNLTCCGLVLISGGIWASWTKDFQPQGRYMLPMLPMLGLLLTKTEPLFPPLLLRAFFTLMFLLSLGSFLFIALPSPLL
ncbi:hypothetical protein GCAAIG_10300 [Candidatus Electronema halotolerans]